MGCSLSRLSCDFGFDEPVGFPRDTVIIPVPRAAIRDVLIPGFGRLRGCLPWSEATECDFSKRFGREPWTESGQRHLVVSNDKGSYFTIDDRLLPILHRLLEGKTPRQAVAFTCGAGTADARRRLTELLTHIALRRFLRSARAVEESTDGGMLHWYVTNRCNLRCRHCYVSAGKPLPHGEMTTNKKLQAIQAFAALHPRGEVTFSGGEPMTEPDLFAIMARAKELGLRISLFTNGTLITRENVNTVVALADLVQVSLDGATEDVNDSIRGKGCFQRALDAIRLIGMRCKQVQTCRHRAAFTLTLTNGLDIVRNLPYLMAEMKETGLRSFSVAGATRLGRAAAQPSLVSDAATMTLLEHNVVWQLAKQGLSIIPERMRNVRKRNCAIGHSIGLSADGQVYPCSITEQPAVKGGRHSDIRGRMMAVREFAEMTAVENVEGCRDCDIRHLCSGGCRVGNLWRTGSYARSPCREQDKLAKMRDLIWQYELWLTQVELR